MIAAIGFVHLVPVNGQTTYIAPVELNQLQWNSGCLFNPNSKLNYWLCDGGLQLPNSPVGYPDLLHVITFDYYSSCGSTFDIEYRHPDDTPVYGTLSFQFLPGDNVMGVDSFTLHDNHPEANGGYYHFVIIGMMDYVPGCSTWMNIENVQIYGANM